MAFDPTNVDVEDFLDCLDISNCSRATAAEWRFSCPFPGHENGDERASAYMNDETTKWYCHGCKRRGDAVSFTHELLRISPIEALRMLKQRYQPGFLNPDARSTVDEVRKILSPKEEPIVTQPQLDPSVKERFAVDWLAAWQAWKNGEGHPSTDYIFERGFDPLSLASWDFGYDPSSNRITFAVYDIDGELIGFKGRAVDDYRHPKYLVLGDRAGKPERYGWSCYHTGKVVFGAHRAHLPAGPQDVVVCEGELNAVAVWQKALRPAVAINGSNFTDAQAKIIRGCAKSITVFFDSDHAGDDATVTLLSKLKPFMPIKLVERHEGDPASLDADTVRRLCDDAMPWSLAEIYGKIAAIA